MTGPGPVLRSGAAPQRLIFLVTEDWYFVSHRLDLARDAIARGMEVIVACRIGDHGETLRAAGVTIVPLPWRRGGLPGLADLATLWRLIRLYRETRPALVHHVALKAILMGSLAAALARVPARLNAVAGLGFVFTDGGIKARAFRLVFAGLGRILMRGTRVHTLFQNADDRDRLIRLLGLDPARTTLVPGAGVDLDRFAPSPPPDGPDMVVALVARMIAIKGVDRAVAAVRLARARGVAVRLDLVGDTDPTNPSAITPAQLSAWGAEPGIRWLGRRDDIPALWRASDVALLPSRGGEGVPKALIEAAACARPLIGTDVPGIRDIVRPGETGILVPDGDVGALADALARLSADPALRRRLGAGARAMAEAELGATRIIARIGALQAALMTGRAL